MPSPATALIIGGGIIGMNVALALQGRGVSVILLDAGREPKSASWGNAGHLATEQVEPLASWSTLRTLPRQLFIAGGPVCFPARYVSTWLPFGLRFVRAARPSTVAAGKAALQSLMREALPAWRRRLAQCGADHLLLEDGPLVVWERPASAAAALRRWQVANSSTVTVKPASVERLCAVRAIAPHACAAVVLEGSGRIIDPGELAEALLLHFERAGGVVEREEVELSPATLGRADAVIVCAGIGSAPLLRQVGHRVPMIAERGYHLQGRTRRWPERLPSLILEDRNLFMARLRDFVRVSSFVEFAPADAPPDRLKWARLRKHVSELDICLEEPIGEWMGARPTFPDYLPAIGRSARARNLFYACGHQHLGLTLAAVTGDLVAALITGEEPSVDVGPFDLSRFEKTR